MKRRSFNRVLVGSSGLGLDVVYNLVTSILGGAIEVKNLAGQGCMFVLRLPLSVGDESEKRGLADLAN